MTRLCGLNVWAKEGIGLKSLSVFLSNLEVKEKNSAWNYLYLSQNNICLMIKNIKIIISQIDFYLKLICWSPLQVELSTLLVSQSSNTTNF